MLQKEKSCREVSNWQLNALALITSIYNSFVRKSHIDLANQKGLGRTNLPWTQNEEEPEIFGIHSHSTNLLTASIDLQIAL